VRRPAHRGRGKPASQKDANRAHAQLRSPGERANAQLKNWHILRKLRCCPWRAGQIAKAIHVLQSARSLDENAHCLERRADIRAPGEGHPPRTPKVIAGSAPVDRRRMSHEDHTIECLEGRGMSRFVLNLIPADPAWVPSRDVAERALLVFQRRVPAATDVSIEFFGGIQFVDQGSSFETVSCRQCGEPLDLAWWSAQMDAAWSPEASRFANLQVVTPCCAATSSLNDLDYDRPAGFASFRLSAGNPAPGRPAQHVRCIPCRS
jgi:hypothetical protein